MLSFEILSLSNYAYHCGSPYKPLNSVEVSRIAEFCTDYCKHFLGEDPRPRSLSIQLCQDIGQIGTINRMQPIACILLLTHKESLPCISYIALFYAYVTFFSCFSLFWEKKLKKKLVPLHFSSPSYATACVCTNHYSH